MQSVVNQVTPQLRNQDIEDLAPDSGCTIQKGLRKVAVYKDPQVCWPAECALDVNKHGSAPNLTHDASDLGIYSRPSPERGTSP